MKRSSVNSKYFRTVINIAVVLLALFILWPQFNNLITNKDLLISVSLGWIGLAFGVYLITIFLSSASYIYLSNRPLSFLNACFVQLANGFTNRVLPSGSGAIATNTLFLKKSGHKLEEALSISLINNLLGFVAFVIVMGVLGGFDRSNIAQLVPDISTQILLISLIVIFVAILLLAFNKLFRKRVRKFLINIYRAILEIAKRPFSGLMALLANCGITVIHIICLTLCLMSVGYMLPISMIAIVFMATITSISVSPTPNGLGVTEVVMSTALRTFGLAEEQALIVALSYRLVTYWLPILPGYISYRFISYRKII